MARKTSVLFVCTGNSCRSQMAEAWARHLKGDALAPFSAGTEPSRLDPRAVQVMAEVGVDMSAQRAKHIDEFRSATVDYVVTVCDRAREQCPFFPAACRVMHAGFADPPALARDARTPQEALAHYRRVRDEIRDFVQTLPGAMED